MHDPGPPTGPSFVPQLLNRLRMRQLALMLAIAEHGTLRRAAAELGMSQPAATKMVQELESALGQRLFEREGRGQKMSAAGARVLGFFQGMRGSLVAMVRELEELQLGSAGRVSVGCIMAPLPTLLNQAIIALNKTYPLITIQVTLDTSDRLIELLKDGAIDIAIGRLAPERRAPFVFNPLDNESLAVVVGMGHPLAKNKLVPFASLLEYSWILQPSGSPMREALEQEFRALQAPLPRGLVETASILSTMGLIADTTMVAVLPLSIATIYARHHLLKILPCHIKHKMGAFGSITRKDRPLPEAARYFLLALHHGRVGEGASAGT